MSHSWVVTTKQIRSVMMVLGTGTTHSSRELNNQHHFWGRGSQRISLLNYSQSINICKLCLWALGLKADNPSRRHAETRHSTWKKKVYVLCPCPSYKVILKVCTQLSCKTLQLGNTMRVTHHPAFLYTLLKSANQTAESWPTNNGQFMVPGTPEEKFAQQ